MYEKKEMARKPRKGRLTPSTSSMKPAKENPEDQVANHDDEMISNNFVEHILEKHIDLFTHDL